MKTIYKYPLALTDVQLVNMPRGAQILTAQVQDVATYGGAAKSAIMLWALVDTDKGVESRQIAIHGTGNPIEGEVGQHIASVQAGSFVWHIFDLGADQ